MQVRLDDQRRPTAQPTPDIGRVAALAAAMFEGERLLLVLILATVALFSSVAPLFLSVSNLLNILEQTAVIAIVAFAMTAVILTRGIDISVGATLALSGIVAAKALTATGSAVMAIATALLTGAGMGLLNGVLVSFVGVSPFLATLATMAMARGAALSLSAATSVPITDPALVWAGSGEIAGLPVAFLLALFALAGWVFVLHRTVLGRWVYAVGGNPEAARAGLIPVRFVQALVYVVAGASAGLGALIVIGRLGSAQPLAGAGLEFAAITAAVIGGTRLAGGEGRVLGTALGALLIGCINAGLSFMQVPQQIIYFVTAALILFAVLMSRRQRLLSSLRSRRSSTEHARGAAEVTPQRAAHGQRQEEGHTLELKGIGKRFPGVKALDDVSFAIRSGELIAIAGENGAGKSTLVKCLSGVQRPDEGVLLLDGAPLNLKQTGDATAAGIAVIHQHFSLVPDLTVAENLFLGHEPRRFGGVLDRRAMRERASSVMAELGLDIDPARKLASLTVGQQQMVEIAKSMLAEAWLIIMDEPTSALTNRERDRLYALVQRLLQRRCAILYITHRMEEIFTLAHRAVVLRDGRFVGDRPIPELTEALLISMMVGRDIANVFPYREAAKGQVRLAIQDIADGGLLRHASFTVCAGEVVAIAGLMGSGRSETLRCIAGMNRHRQGGITIDGHELRPGNAKRANELGVAYIPEDRHLEGFVGPMSIRDNLIMAWMRRASVMGVLNKGRVNRTARELIEQLDVRPSQPDKPVRELSGGNQQKVVIGKWLATQPKVLLLDEPTRGVDVGAKSELHALIADLKAAGAAIVLVSSELPEVLGVADRILVMHEGRMAGELPRSASEDEVMALAFGRAA